MYTHNQLKKYDHTNPLFVNNKLLKLNDIIESSYVKVMFNIINNKLPPDLSNMFQYSFTVHNYNTRNVSNQGEYIPSINTTAFGIKSLRYNTPVVWNKLLKTNPEISNSVSMNSLKYTLKSYYLKTYSASLLIN